MAIAIGAERSGAGKTTVTLALLAYLVRQGLCVQSYKVGPDYIDPMFHRHVTGRACRNLDPVLTSEAYVRHCFATHLQDADAAIVEGVMGLFDGSGAEWKDGERGRGGNMGSTAHIARLLDIPVVLVVDCSRMSHSVAALVHGYRSFDSQIQLAGVVLNRVGSDRHLELLTAALESIQIPILGVLRRQDSITLPDRHLGLVPTAELPHLNALLDQFASLGKTCFDWQQLIPLVKAEGRGQKAEGKVKGKRQKAEVLPTPSTSDSPIPPSPHLPISPSPHSPISPSIRLAIAHDLAFSFYYADNLDLLSQLGAELMFWSPLQDAELPAGTQGLYFGGGFPEMFAQQLADNRAARAAVRAAIQSGMPTYAECGGLMYLCQQMIDFEECTYPMVGILPTAAIMGKRLTLGYRRAIAQHNTPLLVRGQTVWGHEFHRSYLTVAPENPLFEIKKPEGKQADLRVFGKLRGLESPILPSLHLPIFPIPHPPSPIPHPLNEGWYLYQLHASYIHLHWGACPEIPLRFLEHCQQFQLPSCKIPDF